MSRLCSLAVLNLIIVLFQQSIVIPVHVRAGATCSSMEPVCTADGLFFPVVASGTQAESGNDYFCLNTTPDPTWFYFEIAMTGAIYLDLRADEDIDFIIYGPFTSLSNAQAKCGTLGNPATEMVDCSFDATATETPQITAAQVGEIYVMLVTNYAGIDQDISLTLAATPQSVGATNCAIWCQQYGKDNGAVCNCASNCKGKKCHAVKRGRSLCPSQSLCCCGITCSSNVLNANEISDAPDVSDRDASAIVNDNHDKSPDMFGTKEAKPMQTYSILIVIIIAGLIIIILVSLIWGVFKYFNKKKVVKELKQIEINDIEENPLHEIESEVVCETKD